MMVEPTAKNRADYVQHGAETAISGRWRGGHSMRTDSAEEEAEFGKGKNIFGARTFCLLLEEFLEATEIERTGMSIGASYEQTLAELLKKRDAEVSCKVHNGAGLGGLKQCV